MKSAEKHNTQKPDENLAEFLTRIEAFVPKEPIPKEIDWEGHKVQVFVKMLGIGAKEDLLIYAPELLKEPERSQIALILSKTIFHDAKGKRPLPFDQAYRLKTEFMDKLMAVVSEVNGRN